MDGNEIIMAAVTTSLNRMFKIGWVDVICIKECAGLLDQNPEGKALDVLETLHCVYFKDMPRDLVETIPLLVNEVLFDNPTPTLKVGVVPPTPSEVEITLSGVRRKRLGFFSRK